MAHELEVIERTGLAEFFLICWDLMRFSRERGIPAQGRGSAGDSIVAYALGITRVDPIRHELLFERFINEGRTTYPDVDIDFASSRREEVIQYVYERYGPEHTGMVCNIVTYRARSAVREVGYALGFPRPLVDRVAKALETYDSGAWSGATSRPTAASPSSSPQPAEGGAGVRAAARRHGSSCGHSRPAAAPTRSADLRPGPTDDEGGPGDTPASEHFLRHESERRLAAGLAGARGRWRSTGAPGPERRIIAHQRGCASSSTRCRRAVAAPRWASRPGSAGWSCAPASTAGRATSPSTSAACS